MPALATGGPGSCLGDSARSGYTRKIGTQKWRQLAAVTALIVAPECSRDRRLFLTEFGREIGEQQFHQGHEGDRVMAALVGVKPVAQPQERRKWLRVTLPGFDG